MSFQTVDQRKALASLYGKKHGIDVALLCALIEHESSWDPWTIRFEPAFYGRYIQPLVESGKIKTATEAYARAFSWGLMQIMGEVARELGFTGNLASLCDPDVGVEYGCRKLNHCLAGNTNVHDALMSYNGGADSSYPTAVLNLKAKYL